MVPSGYHLATLDFEGISPLLMNSGEVDQDSEQFRAYYQLGQKRGKSLDDAARLRELEWSIRLYYDDAIGPYIPGKNVKELLRASATKWRRGETVKRSLVVIDYRLPLLYEGPREPDELWAAGYRYTAMVSNAGAGSGRVQRCRPCFDHWTLKAELAYDPEELDFDFLENMSERAQRYGLGDYRPEFGSFIATLTAGAQEKASANGHASKARDKRAVKAHEAHKRQVIRA